MPAGLSLRQRNETDGEKSAEAVVVHCIVGAIRLTGGRRAEFVNARSSLEGLDGRGAAARRTLSTTPVRGTRRRFAPRRTRQGRHPSCGVRGATSVYGVPPSTSLDRATDGADRRSRQSEPSVPTGESEPRRSGRGWHVDPNATNVARPTQTGTDRFVARWQLPTSSGTGSRNSQAGRRDATIGHPDGN